MFELITPAFESLRLSIILMSVLVHELFQDFGHLLPVTECKSFDILNIYFVSVYNIIV